MVTFKAVQSFRMTTQRPDIPAKVLDENWSEYESRKRQAGLDPFLFDSLQPWEVEFLVVIIGKTLPNYLPASIKTALEGCCLIDKGPHPRKAVVECVLRRLQLT